MKIDIDNDKFILYINKKCLNINYFNKQALENYIKELVLKIKKIYKYKVAGSYEVYIYENNSFGLIIEFKKKESLDFFPDLIDLKLNILYNSDIFLEIEDYFLVKKYKNVYYFNNKYYIDINDLLKKDKLILSEFSNYIFGDNLKDLINNFKILAC